MKNIGDWKIGTVVRSKNYNDYGHIVGLGRNDYKELIPVVLFLGEDKPRGIHPGNIEILKESNSELLSKEELLMLKGVMEVTREIVTRAAMTGFNWKDKSEGDWSKELCANNGDLTKALKLIDEKLVSHD